MPKEKTSKKAQQKVEKALQDNFLNIKRSDQYKTVDELIISSQPNAVYMWLLLFSTIIIACGLLLNNSFIVVGGMLVTPVITPILVIALYLSTGELAPIKEATMMLLKSFGVILFISIAMALIIGAPQSQIFFEQKATTTFLYLLVAVASGVIATLGLVRKDIHDMFPGIAIAISLVPPLASFGIWLSARDLELARYFLIIFLSNVVGFVIGSLVVFSVLKFHKTEKRVQERVEEVKVAMEAQKAVKEAEKATKANTKEMDESVKIAAAEAAKRVIEKEAAKENKSAGKAA